ncbi:MAG: PD40 domain-containing protein [Ardenticatenaceae bacterium]|nr:PD40 domain-containing protein [Ardenticatenaceae bacterium]
MTLIHPTIQTPTDFSIVTNTPVPPTMVCPVLNQSNTSIWNALPRGRIVFVATNSPMRSEYSSDLYVINSDGTNLTQLSQTNVSRNYAVSSDGQHIAFVQGNSELYIENIDGSGLRRITDNFEGTYMTLHPDSTKLAYNVNGVIKVLSLEENALPISLTDPAITGNAWFPKWSPDGQWIAFMGRVEGDYNEIWVMNADGSNAKQLTNAKYSASFPVWSPDSQYLLISIETDTYYRRRLHYIVNIETGDVSQLTYWEEGVFTLILGWLPDSQHLVVASNRDTGAHYLDIYTAPLDGTEWVRSTTNSGFIFDSFMNSDFSASPNSMAPKDNYTVFKGWGVEGWSGHSLRILGLDNVECYTILVDIDPRQRSRLGLFTWVP